MKEDLPTSPIVFDRETPQARLAEPSHSEVRDYIVAMVDQLSKLADDNGEILIGAMLAEVAKRNRT